MKQKKREVFLFKLMKQNCVSSTQMKGYKLWYMGSIFFQYFAQSSVLNPMKKVISPWCIFSLQLQSSHPLLVGFSASTCV